MIDEEQALTLIRQSGYGPDDPLVVGLRRADAPPTVVTGGGLTAGSVVYTASLAKQITVACAALLVRQGRLDTGDTLARWMPELPAWAATVRLHHLISHTSGLPEGVEFDDLDRAGRDRTTAAVVEALTLTDHLAGAPGTEHRYRNAGYVCLAVAVERAAGQPLPAFADEHVFTPLGMTASRFWPGPAPHPPGAVPLDAQFPAPLSVGDGGLWSTAPDLLRWSEALERDELGVAALLRTPGRLDDGTVLDYAGGLGVREHAGRRVHRHGGRWVGLSAQLVHLTDDGAGFVILALDDDEARTETLADALIPVLVTR